MRETIKGKGTNEIYLSWKMNFPWKELDQLIDQGGGLLLTLNLYRIDLERANTSTLEDTYFKEYCITCEAYCTCKFAKLEHLNFLGKRLESVASRLTELIEAKLRHNRSWKDLTFFGSASAPPNLTEPPESPSAVSSPQQQQQQQDQQQEQQK